MLIKISLALHQEFKNDSCANEAEPKCISLFWPTNESQEKIHDKPPRKIEKKSISRFLVEDTFQNIFNLFRRIKFFRSKFFWLGYFFTILGLLAENDLVPGKNFARGKNFDFEILGLKYVLKHFETIPTQTSENSSRLVVRARLRSYAFLSDFVCIRRLIPVTCFPTPPPQIFVYSFSELAPKASPRSSTEP